MTSVAYHFVPSKTVRVQHWDGRPPAEYVFRQDRRWPTYYPVAAAWFAGAMIQLGNSAEVLP